MDKKIIVMNGKGGCGKDTLCHGAAGSFRVMNVSSIDPIKEIASNYGWQGEKTPEARRFLAELKEAFVHWCDLPTRYLREKALEFLASDAEVLFVHIREGEQIDAFKAAIAPQKCYAVLVKRHAVDDEADYGNAADDQVDNYTYDAVFRNDSEIDESVKNFVKLIKRL